MHVRKLKSNRRQTTIAVILSNYDFPAITFGKLLTKPCNKYSRLKTY